MDGVPPAVTDESRPFWEAASRGDLVAERCLACQRHIFPPRGVCRFCFGRDLALCAISGPGVVYSFTVNHQPWIPRQPVPYVLAVVEFPDQPGVRVLGRVRGCDPGDVTIGLEVDVGFEPGPGGVQIPSFVAAGWDVP